MTLLSFQLHLKAAEGEVEITKVLVPVTEVNMKNIAGNTALHEAVARNQQATAIEVASSPEIDFEVCNAQGKKAVTMAHTAKQPKVECFINKKMLEEAGARSGKLEVSLNWYNFNDLDLSVFCPHGEESCFLHKQTTCCNGALDVDMNVNAETNTPGEHIRWDGEIPEGVYSVYVTHFHNHQERVGVDGSKDPTDFKVEIFLGGKSYVLRGEISFDLENELYMNPSSPTISHAKPHLLVCTFELGEQREMKGTSRK